MKNIVMPVALLILIIFTSCFDGINDIYEGGKVYSIGDTGPAGGFICYINPNYENDGWLYLEAAPEDESSQEIWSSAINACTNKSTAGFGDWFLPSISELELMHLNLSSKGSGNFLDTEYWSSTEINTTNAYTFRFSTTGSIGNTGKGDMRQLRAARKF